MNTPASTPARHPSALALHEYHLALRPREGADEVARHVATCERCRTDLGELDASHQRFRAEVFPATRGAVGSRGFHLWGRGWRLPALGVAVLAAGTCLFMLVPGRELAGPGPGDIVQAKGQLLAVFAARQGGVVAVEDGKTRLRAGDRIRFVLRPEGRSHVVMAGVDGVGKVTVYHPWGGSESAPLPPGPRVELPGSIELDASPGPERVFAILTDRPLPTSVVVSALTRLAGEGTEAVRRTARLPLEGTHQQSILLEKTP